jgi:predicted O-linked N-acetylglucosamine transferase (SPINDLY family)
MLMAQATALHQQGQWAQAETLYREILRLQPRHATALHRLGVLALQTGHLQSSVELIAQAVAAEPANAEALCDLGLAQHALARYADALMSFESALALRPDVPDLHSNRARALQDLGRHAEALAGYERALALRPDFLHALLGRGGALLELQRDADALDCFDRALAQQADLAPALHNRGTALLRLKRQQEAVASFDRALSLQPDLADAWINRGNALQELARQADALASFDRALQLAPDLPGVLFNRGNALLELKRYDEAARAFEQLLARAPEHAYALGKLLYAKMMCCEWQGIAELADAVREGIRAGRPAVLPFGYAAVSDSPDDLKRCAEIFAADLAPARPPLWDGRRYGHRKLRLGYLCGEFRNQATAILMTELFELHDKSRFELMAFDNGWDDGSTLRRRINAAFDAVVDIAHDADEVAAQRIAGYEIDILVNLNGYFGLARNGVFAQRPSPVQVNYLGFPGTMGAPYIDYIVADAQVIPHGEERAYTEQVVRLPDSYQVNDRSRQIAERTPSRSELGLPADAFVFCCFNNTYKIAPPVFDVWMRLLHRVPGSVLWLLEDNAAAQRNLADAARQRGVDPQRLVFAPRIRLDEHLARHRAADLFLDTLPYNAHTTASDALWAGLPVLTCRGTTFPGRVATSLLTALGVADELVTPDLPAYEQRALLLASAPERLADIRQTLVARRLTAPLFDTPRFCRHIEAAYLRMWERAERGEPPAAFDVK